MHRVAGKSPRPLLVKEADGQQIQTDFNYRSLTSIETRFPCSESASGEPGQFSVSEFGQ